MKPKHIPFQNIVRFHRNEELPHVFDVEMANVERLNKFHSLECHITLYPYSRKICATDFTFNPFEEYVKDILSHQRSAYVRIHEHFKNIFGLCLGVLIILAFALYDRSQLTSIESIISVFAAYFIGKDLWDDIENFLINLTQRWKIQYSDRYYIYELEKHTTLTHYSHFAKQCRYGKAPLLPEYMDFIEQSNSQTVRMYFNMKDFQSLDNESAHILSIHIKPSLLEEFEKRGYMFGVKVSFNKHLFGFRRCFEIFQSLHNNKKGCLDNNNEWIDETIFYRKTWICGRIKLFLKKGFIPDESMIQ